MSQPQNQQLSASNSQQVVLGQPASTTAANIGQTSQMQQHQQQQYSHPQGGASGGVHYTAVGQQAQQVPLHGDRKQMEQLVKTLTDPGLRDEYKLKALQEIQANWESVISAPSYPSLLEHLIRAFLKLFQETAPQFIGENNTQQLRKLMLEMTLRMPLNDYFKQYAKQINSIMFKIVQTENEENVLVALKIIVEIQRNLRPQNPTAEIQQFLNFCKTVYRDMPLQMGNIFDPRPPIRVQEIQELQIEEVLRSSYCVTPIHTEQKLSDSSQGVVYTLLPRSVQSLKVLAELPVVIVMLFQLHKHSVQSDIADFAPLVLSVIGLAPSAQQRNHANFNRELFIEFLNAQVKALSFLAFLGRFLADLLQVHSETLVGSVVQLLELCPPEVTHARREMLMATRAFLSGDLRHRFVAQLPKFFDERVVIGSGWTANEILRPILFSMLADLVHHVRQSLPLSSVAASVRLFSRCIHDPTLPCYVQTMCCKLLLNLVECMVQLGRAPPANTAQEVQELLSFMLESFIRKFKIVSDHHIPALMEKYTTSPNSHTEQQNSQVANKTTVALMTRKSSLAVAASAYDGESQSASNQATPITPGTPLATVATGGADTGTPRNDGADRSVDSIADDVSSVDSKEPPASTPMDVSVPTVDTPKTEEGESSMDATNGTDSDPPQTGQTAAGKSVTADSKQRHNSATTNGGVDVVKKTAAQITATYWGVSSQPLSVGDCRGLVKVLVGGVKTTVWGLATIKAENTASKTATQRLDGATSVQMRASAQETRLFVKLLKYGFNCLDIYTLQQMSGAASTLTPGQTPATYQKSHPTANVRSKEEKEALDHFASVFTMLHIQNFKEILSTHIEVGVREICC